MEIDQKRLDVIWTDISKDTTPSASPQGFVLGGQPGAGKSWLINDLQKRFRG